MGDYVAKHAKHADLADLPRIFWGLADRIEVIPDEQDGSE